LNDFVNLSAAEVEAAIAGNDWPGARPTIEQDCQPFVVPFSWVWSNHEQARAWAKDVLRGVTTFAVDGSQISPSREFSVSVGLVQIGWFENRHKDDGAGDYIKDVAVEILSPDELSGPENGYGEHEVEWRRFNGEIVQIKRFMQENAGKPGSALAVLDGSLIVSFVAPMAHDRQLDYTRAVTELLAVSEECQVPVVGYVDTSYSLDLAALVANVAGLRLPGRVSDGAMVYARLKNWGDRVRLYHCARGDGISIFETGEVPCYYDRVLLTYMKTTTTNTPARIEMPAWIFERNLHEWVLDVLRAECVVGNGYLYGVETADSVAVLTSEDHERFMALYQQFMKNKGLTMWISRKAVSKRGRRV
jgi:hypothetical protein